MSGLGFSCDTARAEAMRCLMCSDPPCTCDCPAGVDARGFIRKIRFENLVGAVRALKSRNVLAGSCSYICPTGTACSKGCSSANLSTPIDIGRLQRFVMDWERERGMIAPKKLRHDGDPIAVIGSGPAGLGCAAELAIRGYRVTVFEKDELPGGILRNTIPSFRLPAEVIDFEVEFMKKLGIEFSCSTKIDDPRDLLKKFKAVFIGAGLQRSKKAGIINEGLSNTLSALDLLARAKRGDTIDLGKRTIVIGGGDTAIDSARTAIKLGGEATIAYRRTKRAMPAYADEISAAWDEGVEFLFRTIPLEIIGKERVEGLRCARVNWKRPNAGIPKEFDREGDEFILPCDSVIIATGQELESQFNLQTNNGGYITISKDSFETSENNIFAGGDATTGGSTAAKAVAHGKHAAIEIDHKLHSN